MINTTKVEGSTFPRTAENNFPPEKGIEQFFVKMSQKNSSLSYIWNGLLLMKLEF